MKLLLSTFVLVVLLGAGCSETKKKTNAKDGQTDGLAIQQKESDVIAPLETKQDLENIRLVLQQLDNLDGNINERATLTDAERNALAKFVTLTATELNDLEQKPYNLNDAAYLEECLLVRAAVRGLNVDSQTPTQKALAGFAWVCRTVYIDTQLGRPVSAWGTLYAGNGIALSRAYTVLAAWQQLGLDGCLIGGPALQATPSTTPANEAKPHDQRTFAPVRACGVLVDGAILLFDYRSGKPIAGPDGKGIATLNQVRAEPKLAEALAEADEVKAWQPYLATPLPALAKRVQSLEKLNPGSSRAKLAVDVVALRERLLAKHPDVPCTYWNAPNDFFSPARIVTTYAPGDSDSPTKSSLRAQLRVDCVPLDLLPKTDLARFTAGTIRQQFGTGFERLRWGLGSPRDATLRGMFKDATAGLMHVKGELEREKSRLGQNDKLLENFAKVSERMQSITADQERAKRDNNAALMSDASARYEAYMKDAAVQQTLRSYVMTFAAPPMTADVYFTLATCIHERAERASGASAKADWEAARDWWKRYLDASTEAKTPFPARDKHASALLQHCEAQLK